MRHASIAAALLLAAPLLPACQPQAPDGEPAPPPADAPGPAPATPPANPAAGGMDISQPITALGTEPFWSLKIVGTTLTLTRPDAPDRIFKAPGAALQPGHATWVAKSDDGAQLTVTLYASECSDGMSDRKYPWNAEVVLYDRALRGCAVKTAEMPRGG